MKRARTSGGSVTGGTGDIKPQILTATTSLNTPGQYIVATINLPVPRGITSRRKNTAIVTEILKVYWYEALEDIDDQVTIIVAYLTTSLIRSDGDAVGLVSIAQDAADPHTLAMIVRETTFVVSGKSTRQWPAVVDMTDNNGNGVLVATDRIFITGGNRAGTAAAKFTVKILYRLVEIDVLEFIGITQSQQ